MENTNGDDEILPQLTVKEAICYFTYKKFDPFPFDHKLFIQNVNYFYENRKNIDEGQRIQLVSDENNTDFTEELIHNFISYCEGKSPLKLTNDNVFSLYKLFQEYNMKELQQKAIKYISIHHKHLILQKFELNQKEIQLNDKEEDYISQILNEYIENPRFQLLSINTIFRILEKFRSNTPIENSSEEIEIKVKNFVFNYFQEKGSQASVLFNFIDYKRYSKEILEKINHNPLFKRTFLSEEVLDYLLSFSSDQLNEDKNSIHNSNFEIKSEKDFDKFGRNIFRKHIEKVEFPNLNTIPKESFQIFHFVVSVTIPESIIEICDGAFYYCHALSEVIIKPLSKLKSIGKYAFNSCINLKKIEIPDSVEFIGIECFRSCQKLSDVKIPSKLKEIENFTFYDCLSIKSIKIPDSVIRIGVSSFFNCIDLETVEFGQNVESIEGTAFLQCSSIKSIQFPPKLKSIGQEAFESCSKLEKIEFPQNLALIEKQAFWACSMLKEVNLPYQVKCRTDSFPVGIVPKKSLNDEE